MDWDGAERRMGHVIAINKGRRKDDHKHEVPKQEGPPGEMPWSPLDNTVRFGAGYDDE